jgi:hypothetical protein
LNLRPLGYELNLTLPEILITHMKDEQCSRQRPHRRSLPATSHCRHPATSAYRSLTDDLGAGEAGCRLTQGRRQKAYVPDLLAGATFAWTVTSPPNCGSQARSTTCQDEGSSFWMSG